MNLLETELSEAIDNEDIFKINEIYKKINRPIHDWIIENNNRQLFVKYINYIKDQNYHLYVILDSINSIDPFFITYITKYSPIYIDFNKFYKNDYNNNSYNTLLRYILHRINNQSDLDNCCILFKNSTSINNIDINNLIINLDILDIKNSHNNFKEFLDILFTNKNIIRQMGQLDINKIVKIYNSKNYKVPPVLNYLYQHKTIYVNIFNNFQNLYNKYLEESNDKNRYNIIKYLKNIKDINLYDELIEYINFIFDKKELEHGIRDYLESTPHR